MRRVLLALAFMFTVSACGTGSAITQSPHSHGPTSLRPPLDPPALADVTVQTTFKAGVNGALYTEGVLAEVRLLDLHGRIVATKTFYPGRTIRFDKVAFGSYRLAPALRPCDGNCGYLDGRTDGCQARFSLVDSITLTVDYQVGRPCRITR